MEVKPIPANEVQSVTMPVDFYADLVFKARALDLLERALVENAEMDYCNRVSVADHFIYAVQAILPDTYSKMAEKISKGEEE